MDAFSGQSLPFAPAQEREVRELEAWLNYHEPALEEAAKNNAGDICSASPDAPILSPSFVFPPTITASASLSDAPQQFASGTMIKPCTIDTALAQLPTGSGGEQEEELCHINTCFEVIRSLVVTLNEKSARLDTVLSACRSHITHLSAVIKDDDFEHSTCCRTLVPTALNLVIAVFERCIHADDTSTAAAAAHGASVASHHHSGWRRFRFRYPLPPISFGTIELDNGDQFALCSHLMREEMSRTMALLGVLRQRRISRSYKAAVSALNVQEVWCEDFKNRLEELLGLLGDVASNGGPNRQGR